MRRALWIEHIEECIALGVWISWKKRDGKRAREVFVDFVSERRIEREYVRCF